LRTALLFFKGKLVTSLLFLPLLIQPLLFLALFLQPYLLLTSFFGSSGFVEACRFFTTFGLVKLALAALLFFLKALVFGLLFFACHLLLSFASVLHGE
jgi:hypothetical protein